MPLPTDHPPSIEFSDGRVGIRRKRVRFAQFEDAEPDSSPRMNQETLHNGPEEDGDEGAETKCTELLEVEGSEEEPKSRQRVSHTKALRALAEEEPFDESAWRIVKQEGGISQLDSQDKASTPSDTPQDGEEEASASSDDEGLCMKSGITSSTVHKPEIRPRADKINPKRTADEPTRSPAIDIPVPRKVSSPHGLMPPWSGYDAAARIPRGFSDKYNWEKKTFLA